MAKDKATPPRTDECRCNASTGICGCITYGTGKLDWNGFWENLCPHGSEVHTCGATIEGETQMSDKECTPVRKLRYALGVLLAWIFPISVVFGLGIYVNGWGATLAIFGIVLLFVGVVSLGLYLMMGEGGTQ